MRSNVFHAGRCRVNVNVINTNSFYKRLIFNNPHFCRRNAGDDVVKRRRFDTIHETFNSTLIDLVHGRVDHFFSGKFPDALFLLYELPTHLEPAVTEDQKVFDSTTERGTEVVVFPQVVDHGFYEHGPFGVFRLVGLNDNLGVVHGYGRRNDVDC